MSNFFYIIFYINDNFLLIRIKHGIDKAYTSHYIIINYGCFSGSSSCEMFKIICKLLTIIESVLVKFVK